MIRRIGVIGAGLWLSLFLAAAPAQAATGTQRVTIVFTGNPRAGVLGRVVATGPVTGVGTDETIIQDPHPDGSETDTDLITLPGGTITIVDTDPADAFHFNELACTATISTNAGTYRIVGGTGAYAGATGHGTFSAKGFVVFDRVPGGCAEEPRTFFAVIQLSGPISIP